MDKEVFYKHVEELKNGDDSKFEIIYCESNRSLYNYIFSLSDSLNDADCIELLQETYIQVYNKIGTLNNTEAFYPWMRTIARNKALRYLEKRKKEKLLGEEEQGLFNQQIETDEDLLPQDVLDNKEKKEIILNILKGLPKEQKEVIYLRYYNGLSVKEISEKLEISDGTVKSRLNYGRKKIQLEVEALEKKGTKLYGITSLPLLLLLLRYALREDLAILNNSKDVLNNINSKVDKNLDIRQNNESNLKKETVDNNKLDNKYNDNNLKKITNKNSNNIASNAGIKKIIASIILVASLPTAAILYFKFFNPINKLEGKEVINKENIIGIDKENEEEILKEEEKAKEEILKEEIVKEEVRYEIKSYKEQVEEIYNIVLKGEFFNDGDTRWSIDTFINEMILIEDGYGELYYESTYPNWSSSAMGYIISDIKNIIKKRAEIKEINDINKLEKGLIEECNEMILYFLNNQEKFQDLNNKILEVANHKANENAIVASMEFIEQYKVYIELLDSLRN